MGTHASPRAGTIKAAGTAAYPDVESSSKSELGGPQRAWLRSDALDA